jgi:Cdc6-like AAA superfamily ATPase
MQTNRIVIVGKQGSGKTWYAKKIIEQYRAEKRFKQLVVVNMKRQLFEYAERCYKVNEEGNAEAALEQNASVFFQVTGADPSKFLGALGKAIMEREGVFLVIDEASNFVMPSRVPKGLYTLFTAGRDQGHNIMLITQMLKTPTGALDPSVVKQASHFVFHRLTDENELDRAYQLVPEARSRNLIAGLRRPDDGGAPERIIKDTDSDTVVWQRRLESDKTRLENVFLRG